VGENIMLGKVNRFLVCLASLVVQCTTGAMAYEVTDFYQRFIDLLKNDRIAELETLVREDRTSAAKCLEKIKEKIVKEDEQDKAKAYRLVADELEELLLVTAGSQDCDAAQTIYGRVAKPVTPDEQLIRLKRVLKLCPEQLAALVGLGDASKRLGKFDDAVAAYEKAITLKKESAEACLGLGETFFAAGLCLRSLPYFEKVLAVYPENTRAKKFVQLAHREIAQDRAGLLSSEEIADRLQRDIGGNLMCMCPVVARLAGRVRLQEVTFSADSASLSSRAKRQLQEVALALRSDRLKGGAYLIEGHADIAGTTAHNQTLSRERAHSVKAYLSQTLGVRPEALSVAGMGDSRAWTTNDTSQGRRLNRRIEILRLEKQQDRSDPTNLM